MFGYRSANLAALKGKLINLSTLSTGFKIDSPLTLNINLCWDYGSISFSHLFLNTGYDSRISYVEFFQVLNQFNIF